MTLLFLGKRCLRVILMTTRSSLVHCSWKMPLQEPLDPGAPAWGGHRCRSHALCWTQSSLRWSVTNQAGQVQSGSHNRNVPNFCDPGSFGWRCHLPSIVFQHEETYLKALCFHKEENQTFIEFPGPASRLLCTEFLIFLWLDSFPFSTQVFLSPWNFYLFAPDLCVWIFTFCIKFIVQWKKCIQKNEHILRASWIDKKSKA